MDTTRVAIITNIPSPYRVDFFSFLQKKIVSLDVTVIYTNENEDNRQWRIDKERIKNSVILHSRIIKLKGKSDSRYIHLPPNLWGTLKKINPNVVIAFEYNPAALQSLCWCKRNRVKFVHLTDGTLNSEKRIGIIQKCSRRLIIGNADAFLASSTRAKEKLLKWGADETRVFTALLTEDLERLKAQPRRPVAGRVLYVGSAVYRKGLDLLIDSLACVSEDYHLHIVGNASEEERKRINAIAAQKGIAQKIVWRGFRQEDTLYAEYAEAKVFVLPTREDCFGLVLLEAAAAGVPIVSSKYADGAYDVIENGVCGEIVDPYAPEEMARAISKFLNWKESSQEARNLEKFSFASAALEYVHAIGKAMEEK